MSIETIGQCAGIIWSALYTYKSLDFYQLKKVTKLTDAEIYTAIGWLSRENKINISENGYSLQ